MYKIKSIEFINHKILGNLKLDFSDLYDKAVDTVIIAGENGCGKSTVINSLNSLVCGEKIDYECNVQIEDNGVVHNLKYREKEVTGSKSIWVSGDHVSETLPNHFNFKKVYQFYCIYSDVEINYKSSKISTVTSMSLDNLLKNGNQDNNIAQQINQLIIDIQALDDAELSREYRNALVKGKDTNSLNYEQRMSRFKNAFSCMFENLQYDRVENINNQKVIIFKKGNVEISIDNLSSGEKQIVYRGCYLLRNINALNGAFVFIDEPEISLHPNWQKKIMNFYKKIFENRNGEQTSQIFFVTHSPFIIHNENRKNDKVIVLKRNDEGQIETEDRPEYYNINSIEVVQDAFNINLFSKTEQVIYLEGRTDEKYFNKALAVYNYKSFPYKFKWIGHFDKKGEEVYTGSDSVRKAYQFLVTQNLDYKNICLLDCDVNTQKLSENNTYLYGIPKYNNDKGMKRGIENALILTDIDLKEYYSCDVIKGDYGETKSIEIFEKMKLCDYICSLKDKQLKVVFQNLKEVIDTLATL